MRQTFDRTDGDKEANVARGRARVGEDRQHAPADGKDLGPADAKHDIDLA